MSGSGDYISREAAIKRFTFATLDCLGMEPTISASDVVLALQSIPAADVRPNVTGKFYLQYNGDGCWHCSECNYQARYPSNYCPNCGAMMEES